ncbi:MAG TPA: oxygenase MpaB family protein [Pseudonocardia sp.]|jgi:uncharacterized protein (DUF2236 family)|nr:oxygenase MpaB family protein [Pseudonocardia sp.]
MTAMEQSVEQAAELSADRTGADPVHSQREPLGPDSLTWRRFGDLRIALLMLWSGTLQGMHPVISAALIEHSDFFDNAVNRLLRSGGPIVDVVYHGAAAGRAVRGHHDRIEGRDEHGRYYHALHADPYYWAHATFVQSQYVVAEFCGERLSEDDKERLYQESIRWYGQYGLSMRPVPPDYRAFRVYWDRMLTEVLTRTPAIERSPLLSGDPGPSPFPEVPEPVWQLVGPPLVRGLNWVARGLMPEPARRALGWSWSPAEQRSLRVVGEVIRTGFRLLPPSYRLAPRARAAYVRAAAEGRAS